jgi:hypothetical protein
MSAPKLATITRRKEHATRINEAWQRSVDAVIETGLRIIDAREGLEHGEYIAMIEEDLLVSRQTAHKLTAIASNKVLSNVAHARHLPAAWTTLSELAVAANKGLDLEAAIESGAIHPKMERKDVKALLPPPQRYDDLEEAEEDEGDSEETCWRRGLLYRATNAAGEALYEDWSQFKVDGEILQAVEQAAAAWNKLFAYLKGIASTAPTTTAVIEDPFAIPPMLRRTKGAEAADAISNNLK